MIEPPGMYWITGSIQRQSALLRNACNRIVMYLGYGHCYVGHVKRLTSASAALAISRQCSAGGRGSNSCSISTCGCNSMALDSTEAASIDWWIAMQSADTMLAQSWQQQRPLHLQLIH